jgi:RNA polymerase sigma factor (sigma-70 family)
MRGRKKSGEGCLKPGCKYLGRPPFGYCERHSEYLLRKSDKALNRFTGSSGYKLRHARAVAELTVPSGRMDWVIDPRSMHVEGNVDRCANREALQAAFRKLNKTQRFVIECRFGQCFPYRKVGQFISLSGSRVQQIERKALRLLQFYAGAFLRGTFSPERRG